MKREKTGGREKGTPNKLKSELKEKLKVTIENELENLNELLNQLEPKDRLNIVCKLLPYVMPKVIDKSTEEVEQEPIQITIIRSNGERIG